MNRYVVGRTAVGAAPPGVEPRWGSELLARPDSRVWSVGHVPAECIVTALPGREGARLLTAGCCLATAAERRTAVAAGRGGDIEPARELPGSHVTVLDTGRDMWVFGDRAGVVPVYWVEHDGGVWWATLAAPLAALTGGGPDLAWLLGDLALAGVDHRLTAAPFEGVRRVPPGSALVRRGRGAPYVVPLPDPAPAGLGFAEGARRLRGAFTEAVTRRAHAWDRVTTDLSGGVDSGSVTCLAAAAKPVLSVTYTDARMEREDDPRYARRIAAEVGGIEHRVIDARQAGVRHFDGLDEPEALPVTDLPSMSLGLLSVLAARMAPVVSHGSDAHLTGRGGDNVLAAPSSHRVDAFLAGRRLGALRLASGFARACRIEPWRAWRQLAATAGTSYPRALERLATRIAAPLPDGWRPGAVDALAWCSATAAARWLTPAGRRTVADLVAAGAPRAVAYTRPGALHDRLDLEWMAGEHATLDSIARQRWGVGVHAPFLDTTVTGACLSIPTFERARPGVYKPLARVAFARLVPDWLLNRQTKTLFTASVFDGLAGNAEPLRRIVAGSRLAAAGLMDACRVASDLAAGISGAPAPLGALHALVAAELWLTRIGTAATPAVWWRPAGDRRVPA